MNVTVISSSIKTIPAERGECLLSVLRRAGFTISADCGGMGKCGKCKVTLVDEQGAERVVKSCDYFIEKDIAVKLGDENIACLGSQNYDIDTLNSQIKDVDVALDIGTTTVAYAIITGGKKIFEGTFLNPQKSYGADVISRISASRESFEELVNAIRSGVGDALKGATERLCVNKINRLYVAGNPTMLHIFKGESPLSLGEYPYIPKFLTEQILAGEEVELPFVKEVILAPGFAPFVGGDIACGAVFADMQNGDLLVDIGTNGEVLFKCGDEYYCTSAAAGPAFEGVGIECGVGGVIGAVTDIGGENGAIKVKTIGGGKAVGICGSGLMNAIALFVKNQMVLPSGAIVGKDRIDICEGVYITQKDIRNFQLAKSAVRTAIDLLLEQAGVGLSGVNRLYLAGGMGSYLGVESAIYLGLLPWELKNKAVAIGNSALNGAICCLASEIGRCNARRITAGAKVLDLSASPEFYNAYLKNMALSSKNQ